MSNDLLAKDADFLGRMDLRLECKYLILPDGTYGFSDYVTGGLSYLFDFIGHCEKEITVGWEHKTRELYERSIIRNIIKEYSFWRGDLKEYLKSLSKSERAALDSTIEALFELEALAETFENHHYERINDALENELCEEVVIKQKVRRKLKFRYERNVRLYSDSARDQLETEGHLPRLIFAQASSRSRKELALPMLFSTLDDLRWEEVCITFISDDSVKINAREIVLKRTFAELGFKDKRRGDMPDSRWKILRKLADVGEISWQVDLDQKTRNQAKKAIQAIRERLKTIMGIDDNPFCNYRQVKAYKPKFKLVDRRPSSSR